MTDGDIEIRVACATPDRQRVLDLVLPTGSDARTAVEISGIENEFPELDIARCQLGVFGLAVPDSYIVKAGDRVEVYRHLLCDPRETRRELAAKGVTMGGRSGKVED